MISWSDLWLKRQRMSSKLLQLERELANHQAAGDRHAIVDLADPHGKRFLFDDFEGMAQQTILQPQVVLACNQVASCATTTWGGRARYCAFALTCDRTCTWCALDCARAHGCPRSRVLS